MTLYMVELVNARIIQRKNAQVLILKAVMQSMMISMVHDAQLVIVLAVE